MPTDVQTAAGGRKPSALSGFSGFTVLWAGQFLSLIGSSLTAFALAVYVYRLTGSATTLGVIFALGLLPATLASPLAGSLVDRWGSRRTLLVSNIGNMLVTLVLAALLVTDTFAVWHVYVIVSVTSVLGALEMPAFAAMTPQLVPKEHLGRANGMRMFAMAASQVLAPVSAGFLLLAIDISGIVVVDFLSFGFAIVTLLLVRVPHSRAATLAADGRRTSLLSEFRDGLRYVLARRGLFALMLFLAAVNFSSGFIELLITPLVLAFASADALGTVMSIGGLGMVVSSVAVSVWGGPRRRVRGIFGFSLVLATAVVIGSTRPNVVLVAAAAFVFLGALGVIITTNQVIWQTKVEPHLMGRVMALINMVSLVPQLVANILAGLAVDHVFEPLVGRDEVRSSTVATLVGDGPGRGIALLMMVVGVLIAVTVAVAALSPRLRRLEDELPDVAPDDEPDGAKADAQPAATRA
jgi:MFS family permease